ncbi:MAG: nucleoside-diphosphate kinase [candidate division Zixibacteria bacterium]|nr:nucleoside-diphosphate kinase [candidate division Zixibacteria bacterium]
MERTLLIVKPDATNRNLIGHIINRLEKAKFTIVEMRMVKLTKEEAGEFYAVHKERPFFDELTTYMTSGKIVPMVLEKENAISDLRTLIGATNPEEAASGTIRDEIGESKQSNSVHASDSTESADIEIPFFFS